MGEEQSVPSAHNSAASAAANSHNIVAIKVRQNADGSAASKVELMMNSDAMLTLVGQIIHVDREYSGILLTIPHNLVLFNAGLQDTLSSTFIRFRSTKSNHPLKLFHFGINVVWI